MMGRKKKVVPPPKEVNFHFRMTKELYDVLKTEAAASDLSISEYIRKLLTSRKPIIKRTTEIVFDSTELLQVFRNLGAYGNNLNQIAAHLNNNGSITEEMWQDVKDCISEIYEIRDSIKEMAGEYRGDH